ncbi:MAG: hypothetical protein A4E53_00644 [Pelotomaculum sp. PtaB.Bin104]|nr:MAG: hypothetical protein A4E53_00644 [Pelotomaculum sp. PtaB.Bin104]
MTSTKTPQKPSHELFVEKNGAETVRVLTVLFEEEYGRQTKAARRFPMGRDLFLFPIVRLRVFSDVFNA